MNAFLLTPRLPEIPFADLLYKEIAQKVPFVERNMLVCTTPFGNFFLVMT